MSHMGTPEISAPATGFLSGLEKALGYSLEPDGGRVAVAFEPWSLEHEDAFDVPCLRLEFRQEGERVVLERFTISDNGEDRTVDLGAARDALQAWMDFMSD